MKVLVTGGGGFLGKALILRLLERGYEVSSFSRGTYPELDALGVTTSQGDLAEYKGVLEASASCDIVFHAGAKAGVWGDFNGGQDSGDMIDLVQAVLGLDKAEAVQWVKGWLGIDNNPFSLPSATAMPAASTAVEWTPITPIPGDAGKTPPHPKHGSPSARWGYRDQNGGVLMITARFDKPDGGKDVLPLTFCTNPSGRREWRWQSLPAPRPIYAVDQLAGRPDVPEGA